MARDMTPVLKRCRSLGLEPTYLGIDKKSNRNAREGRKPSEYSLQLKEKQKAKFIYGVLEKPFRNNYEKAQKLKYGTVGENLMILLELRLDNVMFRLGYGRTRKESRQIVGHRHVLVNGKCVNIPSYQVKVGDVIEIKEKFKSAQRYKDILEVTDGRLVPAWLEADHENLSGVVKEIPTREQIDVPVNEVLIVELYSK
jgi:small subunit ribosomal protein S4